MSAEWIEVGLGDSRESPHLFLATEEQDTALVTKAEVVSSGVFSGALTGWPWDTGAARSPVLHKPWLQLLSQS